MKYCETIQGGVDATDDAMNMATSRVRKGIALIGVSFMLRAVLCAACIGSPSAMARGEDGVNRSNMITPFVLTTAKRPSVPLVSVRTQVFAASAAGGSETFSATGGAQDTSGGWVIDGEPDVHPFEAGQQDAGPNMLSNVEMGIVAGDLGPGEIGTNFVQVNYFTTDLSDIVPSGATSPDGVPFHSWRLDIGTGQAGLDRISLPHVPGFDVVDSGFCLLDDSEVLGCVGLSIDDADETGLAGVGVAGFDGSDIGGSGVDEMIMYWELEAGPVCGDGIVDGGESCDDGNTENGDGCSSSCEIESDLSPGDFDQDGDVDLHDYAVFLTLFTGPLQPIQ